ncbi:MAG: elongation factor P [Acidobacteriota bacterium]|jgi:elongation factor P|nr:elongation factor P [Acidobacteriota bacterium]NLT34192.1 elongation factor P [Acidobacteriota bacterium]
MISATQIKRGMAIKLNGELYRVFSFQHITPGNWRGMVQTKLKSIKSGAIIEHRFRSEDRVEPAYMETHEVEYLYSDGSDYYFMNTESFEQFHLSAEWLEDAIPYMTPNIKLKIEYCEGKPIGVELPPSVELRVTSTEPALRGATVSNVNKPATLETGLVIQVPPFINEGELIRVDTSEGKYQERVKS